MSAVALHAATWLTAALGQMESYSLSERTIPTLVVPNSPGSAAQFEFELSGLSSDGFVDESAWLNALLENGEGNYLISLDSKLARTLVLLEVATHDTSSLVDRTIDEISRGVPRLSFDLQLMRENAVLLRLTLDGIKQRAGSGNGFGENTQVSKVMEKLRVLDLVKARMEAARDVLREAESWSTLESEVTALVAESAYSKAAERLEEASRGMTVFQNTPEYEARRALMVSLQNQLEASLSASLVAAISSRDVKTCKSFYAIFSQIQREAEFTAYYFDSRRSALVDHWIKANLQDCGEPTTDTDLPSTKFSTFLIKFYADFHSLLNEERTYIPAIFPSPSPTLSAFIQTTLEGLSPSLPQRLSAISNRYGPLVLPELIAAYKSTEEFAVLVERIMAMLGYSAQASPSAATKKDQRLSKRMSISKRSSRSLSFGSQGGTTGLGLSSEADVVRSWETAIFEPFLDWQVEYPELERRYLVAEMQRETGDQDIMATLLRGESERGARVLWEHTVAIFGMAEDAVGRALALTHGYAAAELIVVIDGVLVDFLDARKDELNKARKSGNRGNFTRSTTDEDEIELEGLEYSTEDWGTFQFGLRLLDTCRSISDKLVAFEGKLKGRLVLLAQTIKEARVDPMSHAIPGTTRGAITMLRQSQLNSINLASLLDPLEQHTDTPSSPSPFYILLPRTRMGTTELTRSAQLFLHDTILAPLIAHLTDYATLPAWSTIIDQRTSGKGAFDLSIPTFSLSPSETISKVGEGLFNLPRLFEVYADDDALAFSIETLPFVDADSLRASLLSSLPSSPVAPPLQRHASNRSFDGGHPRRPSVSAPPPPSPLSNLSAETVISTWLSSLTLSLLSHLTTRILPSLTRLSRHGAAQLVSDLSYISNVARALDVDSGEALEAWREAAELDEEGTRTRLTGDGVGSHEILEKVARIRGWRIGK